ncbi:hypothetical protein IQ268_10435 [Oculatella sp. LEGE 06141]|uniref:hypothetical protein n=1 Tax=Oculatella sp. LEGE 06141 TaxID=1828648 RepID=UPI001881F1EC|nr:hypothetical protein [Oculatella sp. LEGE 06141]MBE9178978.1 hypothetical protein [Oculatella sp. LEGE 06141]
MQYLLMDAHQRFIGTFQAKQPIAIGDTFQSPTAQTYTVVGLNLSSRHNSQLPSLTVIPVKDSSLQAS